MRLPFDPGRLSRRMTLERPVEMPDGQGGATLAYVAVADLWALIEPLAMPEREAAGEARFEVRHAVWLRHRADVTAGMRFRMGGRVLVIRSLRDPDETRRYLVCRCTEEGL
ncbi:phage head-tail adaptor, putative, SPP1 family [Rhizobium sp. RU20A]|uniref:phage head closure protein n=1 Tax=Rhizobium sp. RU20A TaxID=1907412 RepID=UPI0009567B82|nr:phage head closure protein [Rhizobium sp. RU20A]SIR15855.1 phage head-tail adaptor, putative, SPP1 family [Rhizobium sp. RU20A]